MSDDSRSTHLTLCEAADAIARGELSSRELTQACVDRAHALQPQLNGFISLQAEQALEQAARADATRPRSQVDGKLHGIPLAHKDMYYRAGHISTCGSKILREHRPEHSSTALIRLEAAGALNLGGLNMAEFAMGPTGHNVHYGACHNPWNPAHISGGSSSGSGSSVAARIVFGALGSDTGGSIRLPAAACGLVGVKPTQTRVSRYGAMGLSHSLDNVGPLARNARDCARLLGAIAGHDPNDPTSARRRVPDYEGTTLEPDVRGLCIGVPAAYYRDTVTGEIAALLDASLQALEGLGARVVEVELPDQAQLTDLANVLQGSEAASLHRHWLQTRPGDYGPQVKARLEYGFAFGAVQYLQALNLRSHIAREFVEMAFGRCDVLHVPGIPQLLPTIEATDVGDAPGFAELLSGISRCTRPFSYLGLPALSMPVGFSADGLPVACQLAGRPFDEARLFEVAAAYETVTDWTRRAPDI
ncbi:MAG: amidase [Gammaproteobacteria bacterium]